MQQQHQQQQQKWSPAKQVISSTFTQNAKEVRTTNGGVVAVGQLRVSGQKPATATNDGLVVRVSSNLLARNAGRMEVLVGDTGPATTLIVDEQTNRGSIMPSWVASPPPITQSPQLKVQQSNLKPTTSTTMIVQQNSRPVAGDTIFLSQSFGAQQSTGQSVQQIGQTASSGYQVQQQSQQVQQTSQGQHIQTIANSSNMPSVIDIDYRSEFVKLQTRYTNIEQRFMQVAS